MPAIAAVGIDDNLAARQSAGAVRSADHEAAGRIDMENRRAIEILGRDSLLDQLLDNHFTYRRIADVRRVLRRYNHRVDTHRLAIGIADRDLALGIRP